MIESIKKLLGFHCGCITKAIIADTLNVDCWTSSSCGYYQKTYYFNCNNREYSILIYESGDVCLFEAKFNIFNGYERNCIYTAIELLNEKMQNIKNQRKIDESNKILKPLFPQCFPD